MNEEKKLKAQIAAIKVVMVETIDAITKILEKASEKINAFDDAFDFLDE